MDAKLLNGLMIIDWVSERGGATMGEMVRYCGDTLGGNEHAYNAISELIVNGDIEGDLWNGSILWKRSKR